MSQSSPRGDRTRGDRIRGIRARISPGGSFRRYLVYAFLVPLGYLFQVCVMPYVNIWGVTPNLLYAVIGIVTVAYGRLQAFWTGLIYGLLMEVMLPSVTYFNLALYTVTSLFVSFIFADRSLKQLEMNRTLKRRNIEIPAWLRTPLCAMVNTAVWEALNVIYISLGGTALTANHILRALVNVVLTGALTLAIEFPIRRLIFGKKTETPVLKNAPIVFSRG